MENEIQSKPIIEEIVEEEVTVGTECKVILFNDDWHTFEEVINQLIKAINCAFETARAIAFEVHVKGRSVVFTGLLKDCLRVSAILEEIALNTQITT